MTFGGAPELSLCQACGYFSLRVIESRKSKLARRRRFKCDKCHHKITTHEVDDAFFQQAKENARTIEKLKEMLSFQQVSNAPLISRCHACSHNYKDSCSFGFPEFGTPDSADCNHFDS